MISSTLIRGTTWPSKEAAGAGRAFETSWQSWKERVRNPRHTARTADEKLGLGLYALVGFKDGRRNADAVEMVSGIVLDIDSNLTDTGWARGEPDLDQHALPTFLGDLLEGAAWVAHVTPSSRPGAWRWRVIVLIDRSVSADEHHEICQALRLRALELESFALEADAVSWDSASRGYFVPARGASDYIALEGGDEPLQVVALLDEVRSLPTTDGLTVEKLIFKARDELHARRTTGRRVCLTRVSDIEAKPITWLWSGRLPAGELAMLTGEPGLGKSGIAVDLAARISRGELQGHDLGRPRPVFLCSYEDDPAHVIRPRLDAAGADTRLVHIVELVDGDEQADGLRLPDDVEILRARIEKEGAALLVIDPITAGIGSNVDSHKDVSMRAVLTPLSRLAQATGCAVLCVAHTNKSNATDIHRKSGGSIAMTAVARNVFLVAADPEDRAHGRVFAHAKSNTGALAPARRFNMEGVDLGNGIGTVRVQWGEDVPDLSVADVLGQALDSEEKGALDEATDFLREELKGGEMKAIDVKKAADLAGIAPTTLRRARQAVCKKPSKPKHDGPWWWELKP